MPIFLFLVYLQGNALPQYYDWRRERGQVKRIFVNGGMEEMMTREKASTISNGGKALMRREVPMQIRECNSNAQEGELNNAHNVAIELVD